MIDIRNGRKRRDEDGHVVCGVEARWPQGTNDVDTCFAKEKKERKKMGGTERTCLFFEGKGRELSAEGSGLKEDVIS